jgi:hypothetical protein
MKTVALILLMSVCACAPLSEDQIYDREIREIEASEKFLQEEADCKRRRGVMVYTNNSATRMKRNSNNEDVITARCDTSIDGARGIY